MSKGLFITGTGTDVGKTYVTGLIVKKLHKYNWLDAKELYVASQGEAMLGKSYRKILFSDKTNRKSIIIHTNGTLLNKANLDKLTS